MALIAYRRFAGGKPRLDARLLDPMNAQQATNTRFENGKLRAYRRARQEFISVVNGPLQSIYKYRGGGKEGWLSWPSDVDVIRAPLSGDQFGRVYFTGAGRPKFTDSRTAITPFATSTQTLSSGATSIVVDRNRGFSPGDPVRIDYGGGTTQDVTVTTFVASGVNGTLGITPGTSLGVLPTTTFTNRSTKYPIYSYDLGVPAPAEALALTVIAGGTEEGEEGTDGGTIVAIADVIAHDEATGHETATVGQIQNGSGAAMIIGKHVLKHDFSVEASGQPMLIEVSLRGAVLVHWGAEARDVVVSIIRSPSASPIKVSDDTVRVVRTMDVHGPSSDLGAPFEWEFRAQGDGVDTPTLGTHTYRVQFSPVPGVAGEDNDGFTFYASWALRARYTNRLKLTLEEGHGLAVDDSIELEVDRVSGTPADKELKNRIFTVLEVDGADVVIDAPFGGSYVPGGKWKRSYTSDETSDRAYVYTYVASVNGQDFESPPSPVSSIVTTALNGNVRLSNFINPTSPTLIWETGFTAFRIYRLNPGETVTAEYLFLDEVPITTTQYNDSKLGEELGEALRSTSWELPPQDLQGIITLPEGGAAGFTAKEFCMAEPYFIHAWPQLNRRTTHDEIVALGAFGSSIAITTKGQPYVVTGTDPATVSMERIELNLPNLSKRGSVDLGYSYAYPSTDGLVLLATGRAEIVSADAFSVEEWNKLNPSSFVAAQYENQYLCFYDTGTQKGGFLFDPSNPAMGVTFLDFWVSEVWKDWQTKAVYMASGQNIVQFNDGMLELEYTWRSKVTVLPEPVSMGWGLVEAKRYPVRFTLIGDGNVIHTRVVVNKEPFRLPSVDVEAFEVEVQGEHQVDTVAIADVIEEFERLAGGQ